MRLAQLLVHGSPLARRTPGADAIIRAAVNRPARIA